MIGPSQRVLRIRASDPRFTWAKGVEYAIFGLENGYADDADMAAGEMVHYRRWERSSEIYVSHSDDRGGAPVGVLRALRADDALGLDSFSTLRDGKTHAPQGHPPRNYLYPQWNDFFDGVAPERIAELATQGVLKKSRRSGRVEELWRAFFGCLAAEGVDYVTVALVVPLFGWYSDLLAGRIHQIGEVMPDYIGADSVPAVIDIGGSFVADTTDRLNGSEGSLLSVSANPTLMQRN